MEHRSGDKLLLVELFFINNKRNLLMLRCCFQISILIDINSIKSKMVDEILCFKWWATYSTYWMGTSNSNLWILDMSKYDYYSLDIATCTVLFSEWRYWVLSLLKLLVEKRHKARTSLLDMNMVFNFSLQFRNNNHFEICSYCWI